MAEVTPREFELARQLYNIWRGNPKKGGKDFGQLSFGKQRRWFKVAHAVLAVNHG